MMLRICTREVREEMLRFSHSTLRCGELIKLSNILKRIPTKQRLSLPRHNRTLLANVRYWGVPFLTAQRRLIESLHEYVGEDDSSSIYRASYSFLRNTNDAVSSPRNALPLCSAALLLGWMSGRSLGALTRKATLSESESWFLEGRAPAMLSENLPKEVQASILEPLQDLNFGLDFLDMLPYAAEVFETLEEVVKAFGSMRISKRAAGVFYTPSDVSDFIVEYAVSISGRDASSIGESTWLDPACGTGCFLLSVLHKVAERELFVSGEDALFYTTNHLFGIDVSPLALQSAAYALVLTCLQSESPSNVSLKDGLSRVGKNLAVYDATQLQQRQDLSDLFSSLHEGADFVVSNPPYAKNYFDDSSSQQTLFADSPKQEKPRNLYPRFVRMLSKLSKCSYGVGGMVIPLSIASNSKREFQELRRFMWTSGGAWRLAHFDRTPDSLFGDDVKTRNTIVFYADDGGTESKLYTTELIRWNSRARAKLFENIRFARVLRHVSRNTIPKFGDVFGGHLLELLNKKPLYPLSRTIARTSVPFEERRNVLRSAGTSYNWLSFDRITEVDGSETPVFDGKYHYWAARTPADAAATFALVHCRFAYWLWRVYGDGFHLTDRFIKSLPLSPDNFSFATRSQLEILGASLWEEMREQKRIGRNASVVTVAYSPYHSEYLIDKIDDLVIRELELPEDTRAYLKDFAWRTIIAGREDELYSNFALRSLIKEDT